MKLTILFLLCFLSCNSVPKETLPDLCFSKENSKIVDITFDKLYNDKQLQGKEVRIKGIIAINFEDIALYPSKSSNSKKALWIIFSSDVDNNFTELEKYKGHKVELTGNINLSHKGHESYYFATISNVTCIKQVD